MDGGWLAALLAEVTALGHFGGGAGLLKLLLGLAAIVAVQAVLRVTLRRALRAPGRRDLARAAALSVRVLAWSAAGVAIVRHLGRGAPILMSSVVVLLWLGLVFGVGLQVRGWLAGWILILGSRVRVGDRLDLEGAAGTIEEVGLLRLELRGDDGERVVLPTRALAGRAVRLSRPDRSVALDLRLELPTPVSPATLRRVRVLANVCPYRTWRAAPTVSLEPDGVVRVRLQAWSQAAAEEAEAFLRGAFEAR